MKDDRAPDAGESVPEDRPGKEDSKGEGNGNGTEDVGSVKPRRKRKHHKSVRQDGGGGGGDGGDVSE